MEVYRDRGVSRRGGRRARSQVLLPGLGPGCIRFFRIIRTFRVIWVHVGRMWGDSEANNPIGFGVAVECDPSKRRRYGLWRNSISSGIDRRA